MSDDSSSTNVALQRRPRAEAQSVEDLVRDFHEGRLRIPGWQRGIKWVVDDAQKLVDSIYRGFPVGTLLFWQRAADRETVIVGNQEIVVPPRSDAWYVVDGQQRITSLVRVLAGRADEPFALYFDLDKRTVSVPGRSGVNDAWLPMTDVVDSRKLLRWLSKHPEADPEVAFDLSKRIREYQIPAYVVQTDDERVAREVFERTNNTGKSLTVDEVFDGRFRGIGGSQPAGVRDVARHLKQFGFGRLAPERLHMMMLATRSHDPSKATTVGWSDAEAREALSDLQRAAKLTIDFLMTDADIPHVQFLPYHLPLLTLTRLFHFHPTLAPRNRTLVARWLWRGTTAGLLGGATVRTRATLEAIPADGTQDETVQRLLKTVEEGRDVPFELQPDHFNGGHARSRVGALALWSLAPRHLRDSSMLGADVVDTLQIAPKLPTSASIGNRVLHPRVSGGLRRAVLACDDAEVLRSHCMHDEFVACLRRGVVGEAVKLRQRHISALTEQFVTTRTCWDESDRPPLSALWDEDDAA